MCPGRDEGGSGVTRELLVAGAVACLSAWAQKPISVTAPDGAKVNAAMRTPPGEGPFPAVIYLHGGLDSVSMDQLRQFTLDQTLSRFLGAGYVTVAASFRTRTIDQLSTDARHDCVAIAEYVKKVPQVDLGRVVYGEQAVADPLPYLDCRRRGPRHQPHQ